MAGGCRVAQVLRSQLMQTRLHQQRLKNQTLATEVLPGILDTRQDAKTQIPVNS
jgi:hypothetical protein